MKKIVSLQFARKRKRLTDYRKRLKLLKSNMNRLVIRKTSRQIIVQITKFADRGDFVITSASSQLLKKYGWESSLKSIPAAYLTGMLIGKMALQKKETTAVLDTGTTKAPSQGRIYAALKGAIDAGLKVEASESIFPPVERLLGKHISEKVAEHFAAVKEKISGGEKNAKL